LSLEAKETLSVVREVIWPVRLVESAESKSNDEIIPALTCPDSSRIEAPRIIFISSSNSSNSNETFTTFDKL
jgi:hypothetical protein